MELSRCFLSGIDVGTGSLLSTISGAVQAVQAESHVELDDFVVGEVLLVWGCYRDFRHPSVIPTREGWLAYAAFGGAWFHRS